MIIENVTNQQEVLVKMVLDTWYAKTAQLDKLLSDLSDEQLMEEVAPGRNRGFYLLGHLTTLADSIFPLLGYEKQAAHLWEPYVKMPDKKNDDLPTVSDLRKDWTIVITVLREKLAGISVQEWFEKHTAVTKEDFLREPHRNKLNVILSRLGHLDYHLGQMQFLKPRGENGE
ncbi:DinB family protein [Desertivirga brevis]|uniref:DinB family protein n=1 Tax=Desertivirga brevis TaxID=2810310 RepID=UPI001A976CFA|nr:DinB family protein [Pedobacter sp. SYSU D00873]